MSSISAIAPYKFLEPRPLALRQTASQRKPSTLRIPHAANPVQSFPDTQDAPLCNRLVCSGTRILYRPRIIERVLTHGSLFRKLQQAHDNLGAYGCDAVDYAGGLEVDDGPELLVNAGRRLETSGGS